MWRASDYLSGKLLVAILPRLLAALAQHHGVGVAPPLRVALTAASPATLDRLLRPLRQRRPRQPRRLAPALGTLRAQVPLRTWSEWTGVAPGALQGDLVLHCGESTDGYSLATLVAVDVATTWTELQAVWGLHHRRVTSDIHLLRQRLPVPLRAWHSDNGGSNEEIFYSLKEAQIVIEQWRVQYNINRPHSSPGYRPPAPAAYHPVISTNAIPQSLVVM